MYRICTKVVVGILRVVKASIPKLQQKQDTFGLHTVSQSGTNSKHACGDIKFTWIRAI